MEYEEHFVRDPRICGGENVVNGTRVTLHTILASLAEGATVEEILEDFPTLSDEGVRAAIAFAGASTEEDLPVPATLPSLLRSRALLHLEILALRQQLAMITAKDRRRLRCRQRDRLFWTWLYRIWPGCLQTLYRCAA